MICRLCTNNLNEKKAIAIFNYNEKRAEYSLIKMIAKYLQLELTQDDNLSTSICNECWAHLDEFDQFCKLIEQRQSSLRNKFLEIKCACEMTDALTEEALIENNNEPLLDIKDVFIECDIPIHETTVVELGFANNAKVVANSDPNIKSSTERKSNKQRSPIKINNPESKKKKKLPKSIPTKEYTKSLRTSKRIKIESSILRTTSFNAKNKIKEIADKKNLRISTETMIQNVRSSNIENNTTPETTTCTENENAAESDIAESTHAYLKKKITTEENDELISNNMRLKCELCEKPMETFAKLLSHFRSKHNCKGYVQCCGKRFLKRIVLVNHIRLHLNPNYFQCKMCNRVLKTKSCLEMHMRNAHPKDGDLKCECTVCGKKFPRQNYLDAHSLSHKTEKDFACDHCDKAFVTKKRLDVHVQSVHDNIFLHICDICGRKFKCKTSFERHVREHNGIIEQPVQCNICGKWLKHKNGLRNHLPKHVEINVECEFCGRICPSKKTLKAHIRYTHQMQRNLQCTFCEKTFKSKSNLEEHIAIHTGEKRNQCPHCSKEFRSKANMYVHIKRDHFAEWKTAKSKVPPNLSSSQ